MPPTTTAKGSIPSPSARSWKAMAEEHNLPAQKAIAEKAKVKRVGTVSAHFRLLDLPEGAQRYFEERYLGLDAEPPLRELFKVSPRAAECVCELAGRKKLKGSHFVSRFPELLATVPAAKFDDLCLGWSIGPAAPLATACEDSFSKAIPPCAKLDADAYKCRRRPTWQRRS